MGKITKLDSGDLKHDNKETDGMHHMKPQEPYDTTRQLGFRDLKITMIQLLHVTSSGSSYYFMKS